MFNSTNYLTRFTRSLVGISIGIATLGLIAQPSHAKAQWILLQDQGKQPDRQMQFTQPANLLPIVDQATFSQLLREPQPTPETLQALAKSRTWRLQLVTVHESPLQPGYINAQAEVDCDKQQLRIIENTAVSYQQIKSPEDELSKAIDRESRIVYRLLKNRPIATIAASQGEPWQSLAADSPVYQFVCQSRSGFVPIAAGGKLPQHLFAYAWQQVWTDGTFPQAATPPKLKPKLSTDLETIREGRYWLGGTDQGLEVQGDRYRYYSEGGEQEWRSNRELQAIKEGVVFDGQVHWCLSTMKPKTASTCSKNGWVSYSSAIWRKRSPNP